MRALPRVAFGLGVGAAALQIAIASRWEGRDEHFGALLLGWVSALAVAAWRRDEARQGASVAEALLGILLWAATCALAVQGRAGYRGLDRVLPVVAGAGLAVAASGVRGLAAHGRSLVLLAMPVLDPLPAAVRLEPVAQTAWLAGVYLRLAGYPAAVDGRFVALPTSRLEVYPLCSGTTVMTQLGLLAILALCVFRSSVPQKLLVVASALAVGFAVNALRIASLAVIAENAPDQFAYWDGYGTRAVLFPVIASALACATWWLILRERRAPRSPPRAPASGRGPRPW